jgi:hypothetical protein
LLWSWHTSRSPDRIYLQQALLPWIAGRGGAVLLVGCRRYTARDPEFLQQNGIECWTLDIDFAATRWGAPGRHVIGAIEEARSLFAPETFDTVVLSGVFGFGLDQIAAQDTAIAACASILKPNGVLALGWNVDRVADPSRLPSVAQCFRRCEQAEFARRVTFKGSTHVFDIYALVRTAGCPSSTDCGSALDQSQDASGTNCSPAGTVTPGPVQRDAGA